MAGESEVSVVVRTRNVAAKVLGYQKGPLDTMLLVGIRIAPFLDHLHSNYSTIIDNSEPNLISQYMKKL